MALYPVSHRKYIDQILRAVIKPQYFYGSRRTGYLAYKYPDTDLLIEVSTIYGLQNKQSIELVSDEFLIIMRFHWPEYHLQVKRFMWNDRQISPETKKWPKGMIITAEFLGSLEDIKCMATFLFLSESEDITFDS